MVFALFGYRYVHLYERFAWIPVVIIFFVSLGLAAPFFNSVDIRLGADGSEVPSSEMAASVLSFGASIVGFGLGWSSLAAGEISNVIRR
jgi:purine-cytosine permease-like protein